MTTYFSFLNLLLSISVITWAQDTPNFPTPAKSENQLFYLQRSPNANTVIYEPNLQDGILDTIEPVHIFWIRYAEKGQLQELTAIQRKYAYGLSTKLISKGRYELRFLANKKYFLTLMKGYDNAYHVYDTINQKEAILLKMFIQLKTGSALFPKIEYVLLTGIDPESGKEVFEKIKI